jgi:hypothetical protein
VSLTGGTNSGKSFSALRLARGIAGPAGKVAVLDTEGGRTLHLKSEFAFDANVMDPPFHPQRFADAAKDAEDAGYACMLVDSFSMEWVGLGGVLDWQSQELHRMAGDDYRKQERMKMASWIKPKSAHKAMVYSLLQRRMPIVFAIRGEETIKPGEAGEKPTTIFKSICNKHFPFEVTVSFRLDSGRKGYIDLSDPKSWKMEGAHQGIFKDGDRISEDHGRALAEWARGGSSTVVPGPPLVDLGAREAARGMDALRAYWSGLSKADKAAVGGAPQLAAWKAIAEAADAPDVDFDERPTDTPISGAPSGKTAAGDPPPVENGAGGVASSSTQPPAPDPSAVLLAEITAEGDARAVAGTEALDDWLSGLTDKERALATVARVEAWRTTAARANA